MKGNKFAHLAFLNSRVATFLLKLSNPKLTISAGYIANLPVKEGIFTSQNIIEKSVRCLNLKEAVLKNKLPNYEFRHKEYIGIKNIDRYIENAIIKDIVYDYERLIMEAEIDREIQEHYNFGTTDMDIIRSVVGESPVLNQNRALTISTSELDNLLATSMGVNCQFESKAINGYSIGSDNALENISYRLKVNPEVIITKIKNSIISLTKTKAKYKNDLLHKITLKELGIENICSYKYKKQGLSTLAKDLQSKYPFLKKPFIEDSLQVELCRILHTHHKVSFFNTPVVDLYNGIITVGHQHS